MNVLRYAKPHHNIETETVVRLAVKLMRVAYGEFYDRFDLCCNMIVVVLCVELSIVFKLKSIKIRESISIAQDNTAKAIALIECAAIIIIINVT